MKKNYNKRQNKRQNKRHTKFEKLQSQHRNDAKRINELEKEVSEAEKKDRLTISTLVASITLFEKGYMFFSKPAVVAFIGDLIIEFLKALGLF